ncbi:MAG: PAS domain S-box protein [Elusimicrobiota bacterium]
MELEKRHLELINKNLSRLFQDIGSLSVVLDRFGGIVYANKAFLDFTGYGEDIKGKCFLDIFIEEKEKIRDILEKLISGKEEKIHINDVTLKNGEKKLILWDNNRIENEKGETEFIVSLGFDISFREEHQEDIKKINRALLSLTSDFKENLQIIIKTAFEISQAEACLYNKVENNKIKTVFSAGLPDSFPKEFDAEGSPCKKLYDEGIEDYESDFSPEDEYLKSKGIKKYYGVLIGDKDKKTGVICFFFKDKRIKKERLKILGRALFLEARRENFYNLLIKEKNKYKNFFDRMPFGIYIMSLPLRKIEYVNDMAYELTGYTKDELYKFGGDVVDKVVHREDRDKFLNFLKSDRVFKDSLRLRWVKKDGTVIWTERNFTPFYDEDGNLAGVQAAVRGITAETKYNEDINSYTKAILLSSQIDGIFLKNKTEHVFSRLLDMLLSITYSKYGFLGFLDEDNNLRCGAMTENVYGACKMGDIIPHSMIKKSSSIWARTLIEGKINILNKQTNVPGGHIQIENAVFIPLSYGERVYGLILIADRQGGYGEKEIGIISKIASHISDRIYTLIENDRLRQKEEKMKENIANAMRLESLGVLAGGIGHDFNNILSAVTANLSLLIEKLSGEEKDIAEETIKSAEAAKSLASQLMFFSKGAAPLREKTGTHKFFENLFNFFLRGLSAAKNVYIEENLNGIEIDRGQITQAISNIIINASQAVASISNPRIDIRAENYYVNKEDKSNLSSGNYIRISIKDNGCGIEEENKKRIFEPYFTTKKKGNGLGLYMTYGIVKNHGGYIDIVSQKDKGAEFIIYLPALSEPFKEKKDEPLSSSIKKLSIMIVDDEEMVLKSLSRIIKSLGHDFFQAKDFQSALEIVSKNKIDLAFIDLTLKGDVDGYFVNAKLKEINPSLYSIVSSGYSSQGVGNYKERNFDAAMPKPYKLDDVKRIISDYLNKDLR